MRTRTLLVLLALLAVALPVQAEEPEKKDEKPVAHSDADVKAARERFKQDFAEKDMDKRLRILKWYGLYMHKTVLRDLKKIWLKEKDCELQEAAAIGLGNQLPFAKKAAEALMEGIQKYKGYASREKPEGDAALAQELEARTLATALRAVAKLKYKPEKKGWKMIAGLIDHNHDDVAIAMLDWCGTSKEWRALPLLLEWFNFYPDGYSWEGGAVSVDTGADTATEQRLAKAKYKAKYGGRAKKARPNAHKAMIKALKDITGVEFEKPKQLKAWMKENKQLIKKNGG